MNNHASGKNARNILYYYSSQQIHTGSPKVLMRMIEGLDRDLYKPFFLSCKQGDLSHKLSEMDVKLVTDMTSTVSMNNLARNVFNIARLARLLRTYRIDLVHINELGWNTELGIAAWLCRIPVIFHIHNPEKIISRNINCVIGSRYLFVSKSLAIQCGAGSKHGEKMQVLYNPISVARFANGRSIRHELGIPDHAPVVGSVAQICRRKGIDIIIENAQKVLKVLPETRFLIVGPDAIGEEEYAAEMRTLVGDLGIAHRFIFCGPRDDIENFLASIDIFFLPARSEPFGMVFAEAMAAGVPVVASNVGGIPEIIPDDSCGLISDIEENNFHTAIVTLLEDSQKYKTIAQKGYERVINMFNSTIFDENVRQIYHSLLGMEERHDTASC